MHNKRKKANTMRKDFINKLIGLLNNLKNFKSCRKSSVNNNQRRMKLLNRTMNWKAKIKNLQKNCSKIRPLWRKQPLKPMKSIRSSEEVCKKSQEKIKDWRQTKRHWRRGCRHSGESMKHRWTKSKLLGNSSKNRWVKSMLSMRRS